jgi:hypothetical protein
MALSQSLLTNHSLTEDLIIVGLFALGSTNYVLNLDSQTLALTSANAPLIVET